jgi:hypothetical protein
LGDLDIRIARVGSMGFPAPTEEEAAASTARIMAQLDLMAQLG